MRFEIKSNRIFHSIITVIMLARRQGGESDLSEKNGASWTDDEQYRWNGFFSVVFGSCPSAGQCSASVSTSDVDKIKKRLGEFDR